MPRSSFASRSFSFRANGQFHSADPYKPYVVIFYIGREPSRQPTLPAMRTGVRATTSLQHNPFRLSEKPRLCSSQCDGECSHPGRKTRPACWDDQPRSETRATKRTSRSDKISRSETARVAGSPLYKPPDGPGGHRKSQVRGSCDPQTEVLDSPIGIVDKLLSTGSTHDPHSRQTKAAC